MSLIKSIKQQLGLGPAAENHFWDGSVANQLSLKCGTPDAPGATVMQVVNGQLLPVQTGPAFAASQVGGQVFTSGVASKCNNTNEIFDTDNNYDAPNSRFTPNVAGYYQVNCSVSVQAATALGTLGAYVRKNGASPSELASFLTMPTAALSGILTVSGLVYLNGTTDYIEPWVVCSGTGALSAGTLQNSFSASLARKA